MTDELGDWLQDEQRCFKALGEARTAFTSKRTTREQYDQMQKMLGIIYWGCPESVREAALATIEEAECRRPYFEQDD